MKNNIFMEHKKIKILVSAYACEPNKGSEPGVGWNWVKQIARFNDVWVITRANNRSVIELELKNFSLSNVRWIYFDLPYWARFWKRGNRGVHIYYYLWQIFIFFKAIKLYYKENFDIIHHLTFGTFWLPSFLIMLPVPFVWGPVGGGEKSPQLFYNSFSSRGKLHELIRNFVISTSLINPFIFLLVKKSTIILSKAKETANFLQQLAKKKILLFSESGIPNEDMNQLVNSLKVKKSGFRIVSIGNLIHLKGFHLGLRAFAKILPFIPNSEYLIIGDGPERMNLVKLAKSLKIDEKVKFLGKVFRQEVLENIPHCNVLVHPTLHDSGGWVCIEAMAARLPVICLDLGGPALQVTEETGFKIPAHNPEQVVQDMAEAMLTLARNPELRQKMGAAGRERVIEHFNWDKKGEQMNAIYREVLAQHENRRRT